MKPHRFGYPPRLRPCLEALEDRCLLSFSAPVSYAAGNTPYAVATADFNGDGRLDLAAANVYSSNISVFLGNGDGSFQSAVNAATGSAPRSVAVGDFDDDGNLDLMTANSGDLSVLLGNGDGTFQAPASTTLPSLPASVAVGDFNADGTLDLGVTSNVYYPGSWGYYGWYPGWYEGRVSVLLGTGDGSFAPPSTTALGYGYHNGVTLADFNNDGDLDFATVNRDYAGVIILPGTGTGMLEPPVGYYVGAQSVAAGDVNADGNVDLVTANYSYNSHSVSVHPGNGLGGFGTAQTYAIDSFPVAIDLGDFNGDGKPDIVTAASEDNSVGVLLNNGNGTFRPNQSSNAGPYPYAVAAGDFNGDSRLDLAAANLSAGVSVLLNTGDWRSFQVSGFPSSTTAGDSHTLTVTALDSLGNVLTGYTGTVHFTSTDQQAGLPADYTFTAADHGSHTFNVTLKTAGTQAIAVADTTTNFSGRQVNIAVEPGAAASFQISGYPSPISAGDWGEFYVTAYDAYGNLATNYTGETADFTSSDPLAILSGDNPDWDQYYYWSSGQGYFYGILGTVGMQSITVTDTATGATASQTGIRVNPKATIGGSNGGLRNQTLTFTLGANSGLPAGTVFDYTIDWNGDGIVDQTLTGPSGTTVNHSYADTGWYSVGVTATVQVGGETYTSSRTEQPVVIFAGTATVQADPGDASKSALVVQGTADSDYLVLSKGTGNAIALSVSGYSVGSFSAPGGAAFAHLLVYGNGGDDSLYLSGGVAVPALVFGGDGYDYLDASGSVANNVLVGGAGIDGLQGGLGRDLLIGGLGADNLRAGSGGALLIGGSTSYDANVTVLLALMKEWSRTDADYNTRIKHLNGSLSGGLNGSYRLTKTTVQNDNAIDDLWGGAGLDWFIIAGNGKKKDKVFGKTGGEVTTTY